MLVLATISGTECFFFPIIDYDDYVSPSFAAVAIANIELIKYIHSF